jgi:hypothetical protein
MSDLNRLKTEDQSSYVNAINEIVGKRIIANAIGEPLNSLDKWSDMESDINSLLSTFKTNMMNNGITVESGDRFKSLIDKIATMVEEGSGKGIQFAEGTTDMVFTETNNSYNPYTDTATIDIPINLDFEPNIIIITGFRFSQTRNHDGICLINGLDTVIRLDGNSIYGTLKIKEFNKDKITIQISTNNYNYKVSLYSDAATYYAIGVGEEDTTLRDSLASILQEEGVSVTEEDDMASLITKVDEEFDRQVVPAGNATIDNVIAGKTFMNSSGELLTGNIVNQPAITNAISVGKWETDIYFRIPQGVYLTNSYDGYPEILCNATDIDSNIKPENIISGKSICGINGTANINSLGGFHRAYGDGLYNVNTYLNTLSINTNLNVTYIKNGFIIFDYLYVNSNLVRNVSLSVNLDTTINNITIRPSCNNGIISFTVSNTNVFANGVYSWCIYY